MPQATSADLSQITLRVEATPNPATMKFCFSQAVVDAPIDFSSALEAESSPLASKIFGFPWTSSVFLGPDFMSVTKQDWVDWDYLAEPLSGLIRDHLSQNIPVYVELASTSAPADSDSNAVQAGDTDLVQRIKRAIDREIRPIVAYDGGDVHFAKMTEDGVLHVKFKGACAGCPSKSVTLKEGIEVRLKEIFPEIQAVVGI